MFSWFKKPILYQQTILLHIHRGGSQLNVLKRHFELEVRILPGQMLTPKMLGVKDPSSCLYRNYYELTGHTMSMSDTGQQVDILHCDIYLKQDEIPYNDMGRLEKLGWEALLPSGAEIVPLNRKL